MFDSFQIVMKRAKAFKDLKPEVVDFLKSAKVTTLSPINNKSYGFAALEGQIIMVHGVSYTLYVQFPLSFHVDISSYNVREECWQGSKTRVDVRGYIHWCFVLHCRSVL